MPFCQKCTQSMPEGVRFCGACGADNAGTNAVVTTMYAPPASPPAKVIVVRPKRGGVLAFGGFLAAIIFGASVGGNEKWVLYLLVAGAMIP